MCKKVKNIYKLGISHWIHGVLSFYITCKNRVKKKKLPLEPCLNPWALTLARGRPGDREGAGLSLIRINNFRRHVTKIRKIASRATQVAQGRFRPKGVDPYVACYQRLRGVSVTAQRQERRQVTDSKGFNHSAQGSAVMSHNTDNETCCHYSVVYGRVMPTIAPCQSNLVMDCSPLTIGLIARKVERAVRVCPDGSHAVPCPMRQSASSHAVRPQGSFAGCHIAHTGTRRGYRAGYAPTTGILQCELLAATRLILATAYQDVPRKSSGILALRTPKLTPWCEERFSPVCKYLKLLGRVEPHQPTTGVVTWDLR